MTGHLEDFVRAINPLHSSKAGSGCEVKPGWKGQAVPSICVFVPGGTEGLLHASLLIMGIFISPWGAAPVWWLFARTGTAGMTQAPPGEGKGQESNSSRWQRKGKGFLPVCQWNHEQEMWSHGAHHTPTTSFHFPGVSRGGCSAPMLLPKGDIVFLKTECSVCAFTALPFLALHQVHSVFLHLPEILL